MFPASFCACLVNLVIPILASFTCCKWFNLFNPIDRPCESISFSNVNVVMQLQVINMLNIEWSIALCGFEDRSKCCLCFSATCTLSSFIFSFSKQHFLISFHSFSSWKCAFSLILKLKRFIIHYVHCKVDM